MSKVDQQYFFDNYPYPKTLTARKKEVLMWIINKFDESELLTRLSWLACILGNMRRETNDTMLPVMEGYYIPENKRVSALYNYYRINHPSKLSQIFPFGKDVKNYLGRGDIQITLEDNYNKFNPLVKAKYPEYDIVENPDLALDKEVAWIIMEEGMTRDTHTFRDVNFTGFTLEQFLNDNQLDWVGSRKIINGTDHAHEIGKYCVDYYGALRFIDEDKNVIPEENINYPDEQLAMAEAMDPETIEIDGEIHKADVLIS